MAKLPAIVYLAGMGGVALLGYYLFKKKEFPFNEGSIFSELKEDLSNLGPSQQQGGQPALGGEGGVTPGTIQSNPQAVDLATYQNYLQGLKAAFPDYVPNISSTTGQVIAGDPNLFQNNPINGPPVQPYPGGALMPPFTQQMYPYYRPPMIPEPGSMRGPMLPPPPPGPIFYDKQGRPKRKVIKFKKPKSPTATLPDWEWEEEFVIPPINTGGNIAIGGAGGHGGHGGAGGSGGSGGHGGAAIIKTGSVTIGPAGIKVGDNISVGKSGIKVGNLVVGSGTAGISGLINNLVGNRLPSSSSISQIVNNARQQPRVSAGSAIRSNTNVQGILNDVFSKIGFR